MANIIQPETVQLDSDVTSLNSPVGLGASISNTDPLPGISAHVATQFPAFVSEDHPRFVEFMEAYYRWMESNGEVSHASRRLYYNQDIDTASEQATEHLFNEFLQIIPRNIVANKSTVLKYIKQFYGAKGTEKSFKFLFRILFNTNSSLYYPKNDILRASDGKWIQNKTVRLINVVGDVKKLRAQKIRGLTNNCTAFVERLYGINFGNYSAYELVLNRASITGKFLPGEKIVSDDGQITATISSIPESVNIINPGTNYKVGDRFAIDYIGKGAIIRVAEVDENGGIKKFYIQEYGVGYNVENPPFGVLCINDTHQFGINLASEIAKVNVILGSTTNYPGYFRNEDGQVSTTKYIHDGHYYQQFSYVTNTGESFNQYKDILNRAVHPLGFKHFGAVAIEARIDASIKLAEKNTVITILPNQTPYSAQIQQINTNTILRNEGTTLNDLGPSYYSIVREKFNYKPFIKYDANTEFDTQNSLYFGAGMDNRLAITPVSNFEYSKFNILKPVGHQDSMRPKEIETQLYKKIHLAPDAVIIQNPDAIVIQANYPRNVINATSQSNITVTFDVTNNSGAEYTWTLKKNGEAVFTGTQLSGTVSVDILAETCRVALFVVDKFGRKYKSDNIGVKLLEQNV